MAGTKTCEMEVREQLKDLTECCVCSETYKDPKILPCIHTFCMKCLEEAGVKTSKSPGDQMPCPMCRKEFTIPMEGYAALQKNFFMVKLIEMAKISSPSGGPGLCEACMDKESVSTSGSEVPLADMYCADCPKKLCHECSRQHRKYKLTRNHQVVAAVDSQSKDRIPALSSCKKHEREYILYCSECKELLCISCFGERHQNHRLQDVGNVVEGFKNEVKDILSGLEVCESEVLEKQKILNCELKEYFENLESLKLQVCAQRDATIELVSEHADLVMQDIDHLKLQKHKEVEAEIKDSEAALTCLDSFKVDCSKVMTKGSASDICCSIDELKETFEFFKKVHEFDIEVKTYFHQISFHVSDFREFVKTGDYNIIGTIQGLGVFGGDGDARPDSSIGSPQMKPLGPSATPFYASWSPKMFGRETPYAAGFPPMDSGFSRGYRPPWSAQRPMSPGSTAANPFIPSPGNGMLPRYNGSSPAYMFTSPSVTTTSIFNVYPYD